MKCDLLPAEVEKLTNEQQDPLHWLVRGFTAIGGHHGTESPPAPTAARAIGRRSWPCGWRRSGVR
jgi:hypothetical protein